MENIAEILKNAPKGLKLYCTMVGKCELSYINGKEILIKYYTKEYSSALTLDEYGRYSEYGDCVLFPTSTDLYWENWQMNIFLHNKGLVVIDKVTGYIYIVCGVAGYEYAFFDVFGNIATTINPKNCTFADEECTKIFFEHLKDNGYEYKDGKVVHIEKICEPQKVSREDYKKIIEHYGVRKQLKKLSEEVYELQEAVIEYGRMPSPVNKGNVVEEIADVFVLLKQFADWFKITPETIAEIMVKKVDRTLNIIKEEK